jgi:hypothetical protein
MSTTRYLAVATALITAGNVGASLYLANDAATARGHLGLSASGAPDGGVLAAVNGVPVWTSPTNTTWTAYTAVDLTLANGSGSASVVDGRLRLTQTADTTAWYGYVSSVWQSSPGPYGWLALGADAREVVVALRVYSGSPAADYRLTSVLLRNGADVTTAPSAPTPAVGAGAALIGHGLWGHGSAPLGSWDTGYPSSSSLGVAWSATPGATTRWIGVRWTPGATQALACDSAAAPSRGALLTHPTSAVVPAWGAPSMVVVPLNRLVGGSAGTSTVDLDVVIWVRQ